MLLMWHPGSDLVDVLFFLCRSELFVCFTEMGRTFSSSIQGGFPPVSVGCFVKCSLPQLHTSSQFICSPLTSFQQSTHFTREALHLLPYIRDVWLLGACGRTFLVVAPLPWNSLLLETCQTPSLTILANR